MVLVNHNNHDQHFLSYIIRDLSEHNVLFLCIDWSIDFCLTLFISLPPIFFRPLREGEPVPGEEASV